MMRRLLLGGLLLVLAAEDGGAHELRPGYLELRQTGPETFAVLWKVPARGDLRLGLYPRFPETCRPSTEPTSVFAGDVFVERVTIVCAGGLRGHRVHIDGLAATLTDALVRVTHADGRTDTHLLKPGSPAFVVSAEAAQASHAYLGLGVSHILLGFDHLLFVLGLVVIAGQRWGLLFKTITAFTVAHSVTLAATTLGVMRIAAPPLNAVIALSILFLGVEIIRQQRGGTSLTIRHPWGAAFGFGLLHGFGFASGLSTLGLPPQEVVAALLLFNVGVEVGQLGFVLLYLALRRALAVLEVARPGWAESLPAYVAGSLGAYWTLAQTAGLVAAGR